MYIIVAHHPLMEDFYYAGNGFWFIERSSAFLYPDEARNSLEGLVHELQEREYRHGNQDFPSTFELVKV